MLACAIVVACISAAPVLLFAQSGADAGTLTFSLGDVCQVVGGAVTLGFGLWHFAVPGIYDWQSYVSEAPPSLVDPVLQWGMTGAFVLTDLLFIVAALEATL